MIKVLIGFIGILAILTGCTHSSSGKDIYILLGQSNMAGRSKIESLDTITSSRIFKADTNGVWVPAKPPFNIGRPSVGSGLLGLSFAKEMIEEKEEVEVGLILCAVGGTSIDDWQPGMYNDLRNTYPYDEAIEFIKPMLDKGQVKGLLWHQGETDSKQGKFETYPQKFENLLISLGKDLKMDFGQIPIVIGELGHFTYWRLEANKINLVLKDIAEQNENIELVESFGLTHTGDSLHFEAESLREIGRRYAEKMVELQSRIP